MPASRSPAPFPGASDGATRANQFDLAATLRQLGVAADLHRIIGEMHAGPRISPNARIAQEANELHEKFRNLLRQVTMLLL